MNRITRWAVAPALLAAACAPPAQVDPAPAPVVAAGGPMTSPAPVPADSVAAQVTALANELMQTALQRAPEIATYLGLPGFRHDQLSDNSLATLARYEAADDDFAARVRAIDPTPLLGRTEYITYGFMREAVDAGQQSRVCRNELWSVNQMSGWQILLARLAAIQPVGTPALREQALARFAQVPRVIDTETENLREGLRLGYSAPRGNVQRVIDMLDALLAPPPAESPFMGPAQRDSTPQFVAAFEALVRDSINPAIRRHREFLASEYLPRAREEIAVASLPNGADCYRAMVRGYTTLNVPAEEIHRIGLQQMDLIQAEMRTIAQRSFGTSDVPALLQQFKTDPRYTFQTRQQIVDYAAAAIQRGKAEMGDWFGRLPQADVIIEPYKEFEERSAAGASYEAPADDGSRPGVYKINTYQPERQSRVGVESTAFHESIPGHHLQIAIAQERQGVHPITRFLGNSGFSEGWGLYSERLADEMGLFSSDLDRMGLLSNEALRAARMVVDPGMHVLGWSRQQAIDYMLAHTAESQVAVENEVDRYIVWPGQATAYMLGNLEIRALREMAERELGDDFDIREFHDRVLEDGSVTLPMLRAKIQRWIAEEKAS